MEHNTIFRIIYTLILGIVIAFFFGIGVHAFYEPPKSPEHPISKLEYANGELTEDKRIVQEAELREYAEQQQHYEDQRKPYERNVTVILMGLAIITVASAFMFAGRIGFLSDGVLLGGLFTLLHSITRGFAVQDTKFLFMVVSVAVVVVMILGYRRFIAQPAAKKPKKK